MSILFALKGELDRQLYWIQMQQEALHFISGYHQHLCLEAWHINSAHAPLNRDDGGLLPDAYSHLVRKKAAN